MTTKGEEYPIITVCGSMRFRDRMLEAGELLSRNGWIVLFPFVIFRPGDEQKSETKIMLDDMHFSKINLSSAIYVVDIDEYVGESTRNEIEYALDQGKRIIYDSDNGIVQYHN